MQAREDLAGASRGKDLVVFMIRQEATCDECDLELHGGALLRLEKGKALCMGFTVGEPHMLRMDDAYVRQIAAGSRWQIGTGTVELTYELKDDALALAEFTNKAVSPPRDYIASDRAVPLFTVKYGDGAPWVLLRADAKRAMDGGMPVAKLRAELQRGALTIRLHAIAYPGTSVLRQWLELENTGTGDVTAEVAPWNIAVRPDPVVPFNQYWMIGGNSLSDQGMMHSAPVSACPSRKFRPY